MKSCNSSWKFIQLKEAKTLWPGAGKRVPANKSFQVHRNSDPVCLLLARRPLECPLAPASEAELLAAVLLREGGDQWSPSSWLVRVGK